MGRIGRAIGQRHDGLRPPGRRGPQHPLGPVRRVRSCFPPVVGKRLTIPDSAFIAKKAHSSITKFLTWTSLRAEAELAQKSASAQILHLPCTVLMCWAAVDERTGKEVYRMCISIARALSAGTLDKHLEEHSKAYTDPICDSRDQDVSLPPVTPPQPAPSEPAPPIVPPVPAPSASMLKDGADPMYVDFNPLAFEVTSLLSPNEMWAAGTTGAGMEPILAGGIDWQPEGGDQGVPGLPSSAAFTPLKQQEQAPSPPESWQALLAMLNTAPDPQAPASGHLPDLQMQDPFGFASTGLVGTTAAGGQDHNNGMLPPWGENSEMPPPYQHPNAQEDLFGFLDRGV